MNPSLAELVDVGVGGAFLGGGSDLRLHVLDDAVHLAGAVVVLRQLACEIKQVYELYET